MSPALPPLHILGYGAITAVGAGAEAFRAAVQLGEVPAAEILSRAQGSRDWDCFARRVPAAALAEVPKHPRLRRASPISRFMLAAAHEALAGHDIKPERLGILVVMTNACVQFTNRFYHEVIQTPALASPLIFPETVFNAPASHLAAYLGAAGPVTTLVGESNLVCEAMRQAAMWSEAGLVDACLIVGAEECDALALEGMSYYDKSIIGGEGAGALLVSLRGEGPVITAIHGPFSYTTRHQRRAQLLRMAAATDPTVNGVVDRAVGIAKFDRDEEEALRTIETTQRYHPLEVAGECQGAASALQLVFAACMTRHHQGLSLAVSLPGTSSAAHCVEIRS